MREATAPRSDGLAWRDGRAESNDPLSREGGRGPIGADQRHSGTSLLVRSARLPVIMHAHQRLAWIWLDSCMDMDGYGWIVGGVDRRHGRSCCYINVWCWRWPFLPPFFGTSQLMK